MERYSAYSFDLWLTLIKSNPEFKGKRNELIAKTYDLPPKPTADLIHFIDKQVNFACETHGQHMPSIEILSMIALMAVPDLLFMSAEEKKRITELDEKIQKLFLEYPPLFYDENTVEVLQTLHQTSQLYIVSNTGFINGVTIREFLKRSNVFYLFSDTFFSDEMLVSKPNPEAFVPLLSHANEKFAITADKILHVGDNLFADGGSKAKGMQFFQINSNENSILNLL